MFKQLQTKNKKAFTLVEVIVSAIIFALATAGIFATVAALSQPAGESREEVTAAFVAKQMLEELRKDVDQNTWDSGDLSIGNHTDQETVDGITYDAVYQVEADPDTEARKVTITVTW